MPDSAIGCIRRSSGCVIAGPKIFPAESPASTESKACTGTGFQIIIIPMKIVIATNIVKIKPPQLIPIKPIVTR